LRLINSSYFSLKINTTNFTKIATGNSSANCNTEISFLVITIILTVVSELLLFVSKKYFDGNNILHSIWTLAILSKSKLTKQDSNNSGKFKELESQ
jgi:hypothetical protein